MSHATATLDRLLARASRLTVSEREEIAQWARQALTSERQLAIGAMEERARESDLYTALISAMDDAYRAVAESAGVAGAGYFADDRGPEAPWQPAGRLAAEVAAAELTDRLVPAVMHDFIIEPWTRIVGEGARARTSSTE
jgi:hypothetical protein